VGRTPDLEINVHRPAGGALVQDYLSGEGDAGTFYGGRFDTLAAFEVKAQESTSGSIVRRASGRRRP
jgi:hypothetical protein